jgi:hypothetical protein
MFAPVVAGVLGKHLLSPWQGLEQPAVNPGAVVVVYSGPVLEVLKPDVFILHIR